MRFADIHNHSLFGVDDGPKTPEQMYELLDAAWADGIRTICLTPHYHPGYFGENRASTAEAFELLRRCGAEKYPDLKLYLGNELRWSSESLNWLAAGACRTLNGTDYVLVDFAASESEWNILRGLAQLMNAGYKPVLAHAERYRNLSQRQIRALSRDGIWIQIDVQSLFGVYGLGARLRSASLLKQKLVDIAATDAHDMGRRSPILSRGFRDVARKYGEAYASAIFAENPLLLLEGGPGRSNLP